MEYITKYKSDDGYEYDSEIKALEADKRYAIYRVIRKSLADDGFDTKRIHPHEVAGIIYQNRHALIELLKKFD